MDLLDHAFTWAQHHEFTQQQLEYATILQLKILDCKCQMSPDDQRLFSQVYLGMKYKTISPFQLEVHTLIDEATGDTLAAKEQYEKAVHHYRKHYESTMQRPVMKAYKAYVREALGVA